MVEFFRTSVSGAAVGAVSVTAGELSKNTINTARVLLILRAEDAAVGEATLGSETAGGEHGTRAVQ